MEEKQNKKLRICYLGNFNNVNSNHVEEDIRSSLEELGHEVISVHEKDVKTILNIKADMLLFHKAGVGKYINLDDWIIMLNHVTCKKVMWYFDPIDLIQHREGDTETIAQYIDYGFLVDDTWRRRHKFENLYSLKEGIGTQYEGVVRDKFKCDIAFVGSLYGARKNFVAVLKKQYGEKFKAFNGIYGQDLADLMVSAKIVVAPNFPTNEFYWSSRFYLTLGLGGFLVHPICYGLNEEFEEGKHYAGYKGIKELIATIDYYLENEQERKAIQAEGKEKCLQSSTFTDRLETMLEIVQPEE